MTTVRESLGGLIEAADPLFAIAVLGAVAVVGVYGFGTTSIARARYLHLVLGLVWTGCNLLVGLVLGPTLTSLDERDAAAVYGRTAPRLALLLPSLLVLVIGIGLPLSVRMALFAHVGPWLAMFALLNLGGVLVAFARRFDAWRDRRWLVLLALVALASVGLFVATVGQFGPITISMFLTLFVGTLILVNGLGVIFSGDLQASLEARSPDPDASVIATIGRRNARLARVQILLQIVIVISVL